MQIVIDISEDAYNYIRANGARIPYYKLTDAIKNGTPLPKGHGRIIDESAITEVYTQTTEKEYTNGVLIPPRIEIIGANAPTVIEADNAERKDDEE